MLKSRIALAAIVAGAAVVSGAPSASAATDYVKVSNDNGVISVTTELPGQPLVGASYDTKTGRVCIGVSLQVPFCRTLPLDAISVQDPFDGQPPVVVDLNSSDGVVGVGTQLPGQPLLSVWYYTQTGRLCAGFSEQVPFCVSVPLN
ncbi:MAG: hypothetical protein QOE45_2764 [Frankiaceae bacterium]|jgi:hypothetical protein|nr:hypothetical protein [Frankiaceae bacterium]